MVRVALITGASRGIGAATALVLAEHGYRVVVNHRASAPQAEVVVATIVAAGGEAVAIKECAGNNFPVFPKYVIKPSARSQTGRRAAWTPMHRKSNGG